MFVKEHSSIGITVDSMRAAIRGTHKGWAELKMDHDIRLMIKKFALLL